MMARGDIFLADIGGKPRPVLIVTRPEGIDVRANVTVAEFTTQVRGLAVESKSKLTALGSTTFRS